ncbi:MAG: hypothetical protein HY347_02690 [candidate division NC10 bacterium]|nr:hypothetical protein [candidate division NC10 bacterium]
MRLSIVLQTIAGLLTLLAVPFLYVGGTRGNALLLALGFLLFTTGMIIAPLLRYIIRRESRGPLHLREAPLWKILDPHYWRDRRPQGR